MSKKRQYKSGSRWAIWRWSGSPLENIERLHLVHTPVGSVALHWLNWADPEPWKHDHPVTFFSFVLRGWYEEERSKLVARYIIRRRGNEMFSLWKHVKYRCAWWNFIRAAAYDQHRIVAVAPGGCLTLAFMGPKRREWGYHMPTGWRWYKDYNRTLYNRSDRKDVMSLEDFNKQIIEPAAARLREKKLMCMTIAEYEEIARAAMERPFNDE